MLKDVPSISIFSLLALVKIKSDSEKLSFLGKPLNVTSMLLLSIKVAFNPSGSMPFIKIRFPPSVLLAPTGGSSHFPSSILNLKAELGFIISKLGL